MTGIVGYIDNTKRKCDSSLPSMIKTIQWTSNEQVDTWNDYFLSIARLSHGITNTESQPIFSDSNSTIIVMDGNIFEYEKIKMQLIEKGHKFEFEHNDAEYCLRLYEEMGENAFRKLNGCFNIAIYNLLTHEFLLVNDRFCSQPLFYYLTDKGNLLFGTQLSSILVSPEVPRQLDKGSIFEFFNFQRVLGYKTYYKDINMLKPAHILKYQKGNITLIPYWEIHYKKRGKNIKHPEKYYVNKLAKLLKKSVARKTKGDHRFGLLLSGGLDSRMILAASDKKMVAFTVGDFENREIKIARKIAEAKGSKHVFIKRSFDHYVNLLDKAVDIGDGMYGFTHAHFIGFFDDILKECDILLHGYPPEIFFRGSTLPIKKLKLLGKKLPLPLLDKFPNNNLPYKILKELKYGLYHMNPKQLFNDHHSASFDQVLIKSIQNILTETDKKLTNIYNKFTWLDIYYHSRYPSFLNITSIRPFMDERFIVFDNDIFDFYLEMPLEFRSNKKIWVKTLAQLDSEIASIPDANTGHSPFLPTFIDWILKLLPFILKEIHVSKSHQLPDPTYQANVAWSNMSELIRYNKKLRELIWITITDPECLNTSFFNIKRINEMFKAHITGKKDYSTFLYLLLTFGRWHKKYGPNTYSCA